MQMFVNKRSVQRFNTTLDFRRGDHVRRFIPEWGVYHHGIACGDGTVIEYAKGTPCTIRRRSLAEFTAGEPVEVVYHPDPDPTELVMARALSRIGESRYNPLWNNCEDFSSWCKTGRAESLQVSDVLRGMFVAPGLGVGLVIPVLCGAGPIGLLIGGLLGLGAGAAVAEGLTVIRDRLAESQAEPSSWKRLLQECV